MLNLTIYLSRNIRNYGYIIGFKIKKSIKKQEQKMIEKEKLKTGLFINVVTPHVVEKKLWVYQIEVQSISDYCVNAKYPFKHCFWTTEEAETFKNEVEIQEFLETENKYRKLDKSLCDHKCFAKY